MDSHPKTPNSAPVISKKGKSLPDSDPEQTLEKPNTLSTTKKMKLNPTPSEEYLSQSADPVAPSDGMELSCNYQSGEDPLQPTQLQVQDQDI